MNASVREVPEVDAQERCWEILDCGVVGIIMCGLSVNHEGPHRITLRWPQADREKT